MRQSETNTQKKCLHQQALYNCKLGLDPVETKYVSQFLARHTLSSMHVSAFCFSSSFKILLNQRDSKSIEADLLKWITRNNKLNVM